MTPFRKAARLEEIAAQATLEPLPLGDPRYVDLTPGQDTKELKQLRLHLEDQSARDNRFAKVAFTGHRGCGKTTELLRLQHELEPRFTSVHLQPDEVLLRDLDYTELLLWLVERLADEFARRQMPLDSRLVDDVADWFATIAQQDIEKLKTEISASSEASGEAKAGFYWVSLRLLARLKSLVQGSFERRREIRRELQRYSGELIRRVNFLLDDAARVLERHGREPELLIVQDNLDRLTGDAAHRLFIDNGDLLKDLRAHSIFTTPVALMMSPASSIGRVFEQQFTMPTVKIARPNGKPFAPGMEALVGLIAARVDLDAVFSSQEAVRLLVRTSGGSVRDLVRLLNSAQLSARTDGKKRIDQASIRDAAKRFRIDFERTLVPADTYFPLLARIHARKQLAIEAPLEREAVDQARTFCADLLLIGAVLEYNGEGSWFDVHPAIREIEPFKDALGQIQGS